MNGVARFLDQLAKTLRCQHAVIAGMGNVDDQHLFRLARPRGHDDDAVAEKNRLLEIVRDEKNRHLVLVVDLEQRFVHHAFRERIERAVRLVQQQRLWIVHQRADDLDATPHARRHLAGIVVLHAGETRISEHRAALVDRLAASEPSLHHRTEDHVLQIAFPRKERAVLKHDDAVRARVRLRLFGRAQHFAVHHDAARRDRVKAGDRIEQRRLAATRRADDHANLARIYLERAVIDGEHRSAVGVVHLDDVLDQDVSARRRGRRAAHVQSRGAPQRSDSASSRTRHSIR